MSNEGEGATITVQFMQTRWTKTERSAYINAHRALGLAACDVQCICACHSVLVYWVHTLLSGRAKLHSALGEILWWRPKHSL